MKYLINIITIILMLNLSTQAQSVILEYDAAGNMTKRYTEEACFNEPPEYPRVLNTSKTTATLSWFANEAITGLQYKKQGGQWQNINTTQSYKVLTNLQSCQPYQARLVYTCGGQTKYTAATNFTTTGCSNCSADGINISAIPNQKTATVVWDIYPGASYILHLRKVGEQQFIPYETNLSLVELSALNICTTYEVALKVKCPDGSISPLGKIFRFSTTGCRLAETEESVVVQVYPNPATKHLTVEIGGQQNNAQTIQQLAIYNSSGKLVKQLAPQAGINSYPVDVANFASGIYLLKVQLGDKVVTEKFSIQ